MTLDAIFQSRAFEAAKKSNFQLESVYILEKLTIYVKLVSKAQRRLNDVKY